MRKVWILVSVFYVVVGEAQSQNKIVGFLPPSQTKIEGILYSALEASHFGRVNNFIQGPQSRAIYIYQRDSVKASKSEGWDGECAGKWLYTAAKCLERTNDPVLKQHVKSVADYLVSQQDDDGYLGTYNDTARFTGNPKKPKQTFDLWMNGYVMQGLIETYKVLHDNSHLESAKRIADLCIKTFQKGSKDITFGPWGGMGSACVLEHFADLYEIIHEKKYLDFALFCLQELNKKPGTELVPRLVGDYDVSQIGNGKMYEMAHCLVGIAKLYSITKDPTLYKTITIAWQKIQPHLNAAGGPSGGVNVFLECYDAKDFFSPYSYNETCATMDWLRFNKELLKITGEAKYAEAIEKATYNTLIGAEFTDGYGWAYHTILNGPKDRTGEFACCSSSGAMAIEEIPETIYSADKNGIKINFLTPSQTRFSINRTDVTIQQKTNYPFDGNISVEVIPTEAANFTVALRIPDWAENASVTIGEKKSTAKAGSFYEIKRQWKKGDIVSIQLPMNLRTVERTGTDTAKGKNELKRYVSFYKGPLLYAAKWQDTKEKPNPIVASSHLLKQVETSSSNTIDLRLKNGDKVSFQPYVLLTRGNENSFHAVWIQLAD